MLKNSEPNASAKNIGLMPENGIVSLHGGPSELKKAFASGLNGMKNNIMIMSIIGRGRQVDGDIDYRRIIMFKTILGNITNKIMASRPPDFVIGVHRNPPYIRRWWVIPRNRFFNIYLHEVQQDDDDRAMHDHPWVNMSYIIEGGYNEHTPKGEFPLNRGGIRFRRPSALHRLELLGGQRTISLFITGPKVREWGFMTEDGWVRWEDFVSPAEGGNGIELGKLYDKGKRL